MKTKPITIYKLLLPIIVILSMLLQSSSVLAQDLVDPTPEPAGDSEMAASSLTGAVALVDPANKSYTNETDIIFTWADDPINPAPAFHWQLAVDPKFSLIAIEVDDIPTTSIQDNGLIEGKYYWHVRAKYGSADYGKWSKTWSFTIDTTPPAPPILKKPMDNSYTNKQFISFAWKWVDKDSWVAKPNLRICGSGDFDAWQVTGTKYKYPTPLDFGTYCWYASAQDRAGNWSLGTSPESTFTITLLKSPTPDSTIKGNIPTFKWAAHPDAAGASNPQYEISVKSAAVPPITQIVGNVTRYTWPNNLDPGTWLWTIRFSPNGGSTWEERMPVWEFVVP